jgi:hypothetical protein
MGKNKATPLEAENRVMAFFAGTYGTLMQAVADKHGKEGKKLIYDAYHRSVKASCAPSWKTMKRLDAEAYAEWLLDDLMEGYDFEYVEKTPDSVRLKMKSCPLAGHFRKKGFGELGMVFCDVDYDMIKDFNEITGATLVFERDKMLMQGDGFCNHHIFVKK